MPANKRSPVPKVSETGMGSPNWVNQVQRITSVIEPEAIWAILLSKRTAAKPTNGITARAISKMENFNNWLWRLGATLVNKGPIVSKVPSGIFFNR